MKRYGRNTLSDWAVLAGAALALLAVLAMVGALIGQVVFNIKHPCIRWGTPKTCQYEVLYCAAYDDKSNCIVWLPQTVDYDCTPCLERQLTKEEKKGGAL